MHFITVVQKIANNVTSTNKHTFTGKQHRLSPMKSLHPIFAVIHQLQVFFILSLRKSTTDKLFAKSKSSCIKINRPKLQPTNHTKYNPNFTSDALRKEGLSSLPTQPNPIQHITAAPCLLQ